MGNIDWIIYSQKGNQNQTDEIVLHIYTPLQTILQRLLTSTNTFVRANTTLKKDKLFRKNLFKFLSNVQTIIDLMFLSFY